MAAFWVLQAATGIAVAFRWEIDDGLLPGERVPVRVAALGQRIEALSRQGCKVSSMWASSGAADRFDIYYQNPAGIDRVMRVDGTGQMLRDGRDGAVVGNGGIFHTLTSIHTSLLSGTTGEWIVGISGVLLLMNLILGLRLGWPRQGAVRRSMLVRPGGSERARFYGSHRMIGLWVVVPVLFVVSTGVLLTFKSGLEAMLVAATPAPIAARTAQIIAPGQALQIALDRYPGASISALAMPSDDEPWFKVRLRVLGELRQNWGRTTLLIDTSEGRVLADRDARHAVGAGKVLDSLYPLHTGQYAGIPGRVFLMAAATALIALVIMGQRLWRVPRR